METIKLICITPIKNESWILEKFLTFTSEWADHIIIADQNSTDNSVKIAQQFDKVQIVKNEGEYNEFERTKILIREARKIEGRKIIFALDVDEFLSANFKDSPEWNTILNSPEKTIINIHRINLTPNFDKYFADLRMVCALVDDGKSTIENTSKSIIHNIRLPWPKGAKQLFLNDIKCLHLDSISHERVLSKARWYQCFEKEKLKHDDTYVLSKYKYSKKFDDFIKYFKVEPLPSNLIQGFIDRNMDFTSYQSPHLWWDDDLLELFDKVGIQKFKNLSINEVNWVEKAKMLGYKDMSKFIVERNIVEKIIRKFKKLIRN
jgi:hypothetical protein